jgi:hypothetical protein
MGASGHGSKVTPRTYRRPHIRPQAFTAYYHRRAHVVACIGQSPRRRGLLNTSHLEIFTRAAIDVF